MSTFDAANFYFSGQGVVMIGSRDAVTGNPIGLRPVGNVSDLKISVATTVVDHKGSQDGQRAIDARLQTETKATLSMTLDNWNSANLAKALRGGQTIIAGGTVTAEAFEATPGMVSGFKYINVSSVVVKQSTTSLVAYSVPGTPWDYKLNAAAGSILLNDGTQDTGFSAFLPGGSGLTLTAADAAVGEDTVYVGTITGGAAGALAGQEFVVTGFVASTGANNGTFLCVDSTATTLTLRNPIGVSETHAGNALSESTSSAYNLTVNYTYPNQFLVNSLTQPLTDSWVRFEGLNTVDTNLPVVVEVFRFSNDPLKELALISDTFGQFVLEGAVLKDFTRPSDGISSAYFTVKKTDS